MRQFLALLLFFISCPLIYAQFSGDNLHVLGIYENNYQSTILHVHLENTNSNPDSNLNGQVYTQIGLINEKGDTFLLSFAQFSLPTLTHNKLVYPIQLHPPFKGIHEIPDFRCGRLFTRFPDANIPYCLDTFPKKSELADQLTCSDYRIEGVFEMASGGTKEYSLVMSSRHPDSLKTFTTGYTSFQFFDVDGDPVSDKTPPSYMLPEFYGEKFSYPISFNRRLVDGERLKLELQFPDCEYTFSYDIVSQTLQAEKPKPIVFPNPVQNRLTVQSEWSLSTIQIYDAFGRLVLTSKESTIDMTELPKGIYWLRMQAEQAVWSQKVMKD